MDDNHQNDASGTFSRRDFLSMAGSVAAAPLVNLLTSKAAQASDSPKKTQGQSGSKPNILFIFTDQERYITKWPQGFQLPGHEQLMRKGVTFQNHYCPAVMCTSSRAVLLTGLQTPDNGMYENVDMPYVKNMSTSIPTIGHMLRKAGYYTAYKGKWHLNREFDARNPTHLFEKDMDAYGFSDFVLPIDGFAHANGGYNTDQLITSGAISWLREKGQSLNSDGKPWALFVSLINPHDIMYFNTDAPGENVQDNGHLMMHAARAPNHAHYQRRWNSALPSNLNQPLNAPGRPTAHTEFNRAWGYTLGNIPLESERWQRFNDFYYNSISMVDAQMSNLLRELDNLGLDGNTIVVFTSDHGEMGGAHGLRGKGPMAYQEEIHLPLIISHPDVKGGQNCASLTGHIDLAPTLLAMAGVSPTASAEFAGRELPGKDMSTLFNRPGASDLHAVRNSVLFTYSGLATNDSNLTRIISEGKAKGQDPKSAIRAAGYKPNMNKRGSLRSVFDGRYKLTRYFAPIDRNSPKNLDELYQWNDVELFDLKSDPKEMNNLAINRQANAETLLAMNAKLEAIIKTEIGVDDGREMPKLEGVDWQIDRIDL